MRSAKALSQFSAKNRRWFIVSAPASQIYFTRKWAWRGSGHFSAKGYGLFVRGARPAAGRLPSIQAFMILEAIQKFFWRDVDKKAEVKDGLLELKPEPLKLLTDTIT